MFYELFLLDEETDDMMPVPVLLKDYRDSSLNFLNVNEYDIDEGNDVFVRRFMLYDPLSGELTVTKFVNSSETCLNPLYNFELR